MTEQNPADPGAAGAGANDPARPAAGGGGRSPIRKAALGAGALLGLLVLYLLAWPAPIDPLPFEPPAAMPLSGALAPNEALRAASLLAKGAIVGPEDVDVDAEGRVYAGLEDGRIVRVLADGAIETFADTGGRPLGLDFDARGNLLVADGKKGLLRVSPAGEVTELSTGADGVPFGFADDVAVASDGRVYFSDASHRWGIDEYLYDLLEGRPYGRLLRYDPETKKTEVLLDGLYFANGIALSADESFVLCTETYRYRITRYWLAGEKAGTSDVFLDGLPGYPDGISASGRGTFWLALFTVRNATAEGLAPSPFKKKVLSRLPKLFWPKPEPYGLAVELDESGKVLRSLQDPGGAVVPNVTSVEEQGGKIYLGNLSGDQIPVYTLGE